jgi:hypothetical protein
LRVFLALTLVLLVSCSKNNEEKINKAIDVAQSHLSRNRCDEAIKVLEEAGSSRNPIYLQVLASGYACRAGYSTIDFLLDDLSSIDTTSPSDLFPSISTLSLSEETSVESANYRNLRTALSLLLSGANPSHASRVAAYGERKAGDMSVQILFLSIVQLGKFLSYYGSVDTNGSKGARSVSSNKCFLTYTDSDAIFVTNSPATGSCNPSETGHPELAFDTTVNLPITRRRLCEGVVLVGNIIDILESIDFSAIDALQSLGNFATLVTNIKATITDQAVATILETTSQTTCVSMAGTPTGFDELQRYYAYIFEVGLP